MTRFFLIALCLAPSLPAAGEIDAQAIFASLEASVVSVSDPEGGGSGVVLTEDGLILTNFHVANTPLPQKVEALVQEGGKPVRKTFDKVKLMKVHATKDLALLKVDGEGSRFKPGKLSKSEADTVAGGSTVALGYPFVPGQDKPVLTITKGIISSANRKVAGNDYIQLDAAINPGNSGGALVNAKGIIIGIPTIKFEGSDSIGLATPLAGLRMDQFIDPADRKGNPEEAKRLSALASNLMLRDALSFGLDDTAVQLALFLQREALAQDPNNPALAESLGSMYYRLGEREKALAYAEHALKRDPDNIFSRELAAACQDQLGMPEKALANRLACLGIEVSGDELKRKVGLMDKLASGLVEAGDPVRALYVLSWRMALEGNPPTAEQRLVMQKAGSAIPSEVSEKIMATKSGHSVAEMDRLASGTKLAMPDKPAEPIAPADPSLVKPVVAGSDKVSSKVSFAAGVTASLVDAPPGVVYDEATMQLEWTPAPFSKLPAVRVLFLIKKPDGTEETLVHVMER